MPLSIHLRIDRHDPRHVTFTVFLGKAPNMTHANAGTLTTTPSEFLALVDLLKPTEIRDHSRPVDTVMSSRRAFDDWRRAAGW